MATDCDNNDENPGDEQATASEPDRPYFRFFRRIFAAAVCFGTAFVLYRLGFETGAGFTTIFGLYMTIEAARS
jgi:uncharacterized membrane protein YccC